MTAPDIREVPDELESAIDRAATLKRRLEFALGIAIGLAILGWLR